MTARRIVTRAAVATDEADTLRDLARLVRRLWPWWHDPARFYRERDEIEHILARLADAQRCEGSPR